MRTIQDLVPTNVNMYRPQTEKAQKQLLKKKIATACGIQTFSHTETILSGKKKIPLSNLTSLSPAGANTASYWSIDYLSLL
jgi:hypothetical protein